MNSKKLFFIMIGVIILLCALTGGMVYVGNFMLSRQAQQLVSAKLDSQVIEEQQAALNKAKQDIKQYTELDNIAKQIVPQDKDQAKVTREIVNIADQVGIKISNVTFPVSTLGNAATGGSTADTTKPAVTTSPTPTQLKPVQGINDLYQLDINVTSDTGSPTTYDKLLAFLNQLEQNRRTSQVTQLSITPDAKNRSLLNFSITLTVYTKP